MRRPFLALATSALLAAGPLSVGAQPPQPPRHHVQPHPEARQRLHTWFKDSVAPELRSWQASYDASLGAADLRTLMALRTRAAALLASHRPPHHERGPGPTADTRPGDRRGDRRDSMRVIMDELRPILERSAPALRALLDEHRAELQGWHRHLHAMVTPPVNAEADTLRHRRRHHAPGHRLPIPFGLDNRRRSAVAFVLWDGTVPPEPHAGQLEQNGLVAAIDASSELPPSLTISPTPSASTAYLRASGLADGQATVEILSMNGELLQSLPVTIADGTVSLPLTVDALANGSYMASIRTPAGRRTTHLIVRH